MKPTLEQLAATIKDHAGDIFASNRKGLDHAYEAGKLLKQAKPLTMRAGLIFDKWVEDNCGVKIRQARKYMRVADHWRRISAYRRKDVGLSIDDALRLVAERRGGETNRTRQDVPETATTNERHSDAGEEDRHHIRNVLSILAEMDPDVVRTKMTDHNLVGEPSDLLSLLKELATVPA